MLKVDVVPHPAAAATAKCLAFAEDEKIVAKKEGVSIRIMVEEHLTRQEKTIVLVTVKNKWRVIAAMRKFQQKSRDSRTRSSSTETSFANTRSRKRRGPSLKASR